MASFERNFLLDRLKTVKPEKRESYLQEKLANPRYRQAATELLSEMAGPAVQQTPSAAGPAAAMAGDAGFAQQIRQAIGQAGPPSAAPSDPFGMMNRPPPAAPPPALPQGGAPSAGLQPRQASSLPIPPPMSPEWAGVPQPGGMPAPPQAVPPQAAPGGQYAGPPLGMGGGVEGGMPAPQMGGPAVAMPSFPEIEPKKEEQPFWKKQGFSRNLLEMSLNLMNAAQPKMVGGIPMKPSLLGALGQAGGQTMSNLRAFERQAGAARLKERGVAATESQARTARQRAQTSAGTARQSRLDRLQREKFRREDRKSNARYRIDQMRQSAEANRLRAQTVGTARERLKLQKRASQMKEVAANYERRIVQGGADTQRNFERVKKQVMGKDYKLPTEAPTPPVKGERVAGKLYKSDMALTAGGKTYPPGTLFWWTGEKFDVATD